jgi:hypothetical protein
VEEAHVFSPGSRYEKQQTYTIRLRNGREVTVVKVPEPLTTPLFGYHRRLEGQRLDLIAAHHLRDATGFWRLCDANNTVVPNALESRNLVGLPGKER